MGKWNLQRTKADDLRRRQTQERLDEKRAIERTRKAMLAVKKENDSYGRAMVMLGDFTASPVGRNTAREAERNQRKLEKAAIKEAQARAEKYGTVEGFGAF